MQCIITHLEVFNKKTKNGLKLHCPKDCDIKQVEGNTATIFHFLETDQHLLKQLTILNLMNGWWDGVVEDQEKLDITAKL